MSVAITIRNVPDDVRDRLAERAARSGRSLQEYLSAELRHLAFAPSAAEAVVQARLSAQSFPEWPMADIVAAVDAERR
jgi:plasmid stability protein